MQTAPQSTGLTTAKSAVIGSTILQCLFGVAALLARLLGGKPTTGIVLTLAVLGLAALAVSLLALWVYHVRRPEVRGWNHLDREAKGAEQAVAGIEAELTKAIDEVESAREQAARERSAQTEQLQSITLEIDSHIARASESRDQALASSLALLQREHVDAGLRAIPLNPTLVPGVGEVLAEKLRSVGISTAYDVTPEAVSQAPGIGGSLGLSLSRWRESEERLLTETQPRSLSEEQHASIVQSYEEHIRSAHQEREAASLGHDREMETIRAREAQALASLAVRETTTRQRLETAVMQRQALQEELGRLKRPSFSGQLWSVLSGDDTTWRGRLGAAALLAGFLGFGIANAGILVAALLQ